MRGKARARKTPVTTGSPGKPPPGCPEELVVVGEAAVLPSVGEPVCMILAAGRPQLVVAGRVASLVSTRPGMGVDVLQRCMELGERYLGTVTRVTARQFEADLSR